jgi:predicted nucleotide-binding protein (sugar kinase/HSP70/actin superfamily)
MLEEDVDRVFLPLIRALPKAGDERFSKTCPMVQAGPDMIRWTVGRPRDPRIVSPVIDFGDGNLESAEFRRSCRRLADELGHSARWRRAWERARLAQVEFDRECRAIGKRALDFCATHGLPAIVVLGRPYTIYNRVLNSNIPALLREQGAMAIPLECYPVSERTALFHDMYWAYGQRILRAAHQIRRTPGVYGLYASNYACGPDSFNLHFCGFAMDGKPFAVVETDGHSGDAGTKTRVEAFLYCVREDFRNGTTARKPNDLSLLRQTRTGWEEIRASGQRLLLPSMGPPSEALAACFRGLGIRAEVLPPPNAETLRYGRRHTSGKECLPMCVTLGSLLQFVERAHDSERVAFLMPRALGPCRFGVYNLLHQIVVQRLGLEQRVRVWSPAESGYFEGLPSGASVLVFAGCVAADLLSESLLEVRPVERRIGAADDAYARYQGELLRRLEQAAAGELSAADALWQVANEELFGLRALLERAAAEFASLGADGRLPTVLVAGEIYVRLDPFSNGQILRQLERRGLRLRLAPCNEWLEYVGHTNREAASPFAVSPRLTTFVQGRIQKSLHEAVARRLPSILRVTVPESLEAAAPYLRSSLKGEAVLTIGGPVHAWRQGKIDAVVSVGPLECMPNKVAEAQLFHVGEQEGLLNLTLSLNGEPVAPDVLDNFAFEVHERFRRKWASREPQPRSPRPGAEPAACVLAGAGACDGICPR